MRGPGTLTPLMDLGLGFRVKVLGCRVYDLGFRA